VCETELRPAARFCDGCGAAVPGAKPPLRRDLRDYTPRHLAERILTLRSALEGEHKPVSVRVADVRGSMGLSERVDLETWHGIMNRFFEIAGEVVHRFEGTVNQFTGDGFMALFGAPLAHEDHAQRACYAALALRDELAPWALELRRAFGLDFGVRMGLHSGEVVVGRIGDDLRMDYTAQGHTVGLAARMEQMADAGCINVSERTAALVRGFCRLRELGRFRVKGVREPQRVFRLEGLGSLRTRFDASRSRGFSGFVGRERQLAVLEDAFRSVARGRGCVIGVVGDAGLGKSRLCFEFSERCRRRGTRVRVAQALAHGRAIPFLPLLELLRDFFGVGEEEDDAAARARIEKSALALDPGLAGGVPVLCEFLGVRGPAAPAPTRDPEARQRLLLDTVMRLVRSGSRGAPAVLLFEDLHWLDAGSETFLARLVEIAAETRTLVLVNFRPEYRARWMQAPAYTELRLAPLDAAEVEELLDGLLGREPATTPLKRAIRERTEGNPFFVEEVVRSLLDAGALERAEGGLRPTRPLTPLEVPASVHAVVSARIDHLGEREKQALQTAAVIGRSFPETLLARVLGLPDPALRASLTALVDAGFLYRESERPAVYAFAHSLTLEVAYASQLADARARVHAAVAEALEDLRPGRLDEIAALLAHHAQSAGRRLDAARWHRRAAGWVGVSDVDAAHHHWSSVMELVGDAPEGEEATALALSARIWLQQLAWRLGFSKAEAARNLARGLALVERSGDRAAGVLLRIGYAAYRGVIGDLEGQYRHGAEAERIADELASVPLALGSRLIVANSLHYQGRLREALAVADLAVARRPEDDAAIASEFWISPYVYILGLRGASRSLCGGLAAGESDLRQALALARRRDDPEALGCVHGFLVQHARCAGDARAAVHHGRHMLEVAEKTGIPLLLVDAHLSLGLAFVEAREWELAVAALERARAIVEGRHILLGPRPRILAALAEAELGRGEPGRARALATELLEHPHVSSMRLVALAGQLVLARALLRAEGSAAAGAVHAAAAAAVGLIEASGAASFEPAIHEVLAELARCAGDDVTRRRHAAAAARLRGEMAGAAPAPAAPAPPGQLAHAGR
jgi:class 3 adenylate cyclase/tetratricopeptide (TPR) repeat protein